MRNSSGNRSKGGDAFREWLSDRLRYFILLFAFLIAVAAITIVSRFLDQRLNLNNRNVQDPGSASAVLSDKETEEPIVILSSGGETPEAVQEKSQEPAAEKPEEGKKAE